MAELLWDILVFSFVLAIFEPPLVLPFGFSLKTQLDLSFCLKGIRQNQRYCITKKGAYQLKDVRAYALGSGAREVGHRDIGLW